MALTGVRKKSLAKIGQTFNRLTCLYVFQDPVSGNAQGRFQCECGSTYTGKFAAVVFGNTKSCGCLNTELLEARNHKHGMAGSKIYGIWSEMVARCHRPTHVRYGDYGGRGIDVASEWHDFNTFFADMGERPQGLSLDRVDNSKGYSKENCRWATTSEQATNKRNNRFLTAFGRTIPISWWAHVIGCGSSELNRLLKKHHIEDIIVSRVPCDGVEELCMM